MEDSISIFHQKRLEYLKEKSNLPKILKQKNPYLFKAKNILTAQDLIKGFLDAFLSSQEETLFGEFIEGLAILVCEQVFGGWKSGIRGIDLEFNRDNIRYIVNIKSGPNWGNSSQIAKMKDDFKRAQRTLRTSHSGLSSICVNGCCYGRDRHPDKGDYFKYCGQRFWEFISGEENLYIDIIEPIAYQAKEKNKEFLEKYAQLINKLTLEFAEKFCLDGKINWQKLMEFNSGVEKV